MYVPAHFAMSDSDVRSLLASITAVDLITPTTDGLVATFLPMLFEPKTGAHGALLGHVARNNPHWRSASDDAADSSVAGGESLVIARGPDAYVSPTWYPSTAEHGRVVPTWNYLTVHVYGRLVAHDDIEWLRQLVTRLTTRYEAGFDEPWQVSDAPADFIEGQLRAIVGLELQITRIEAKAKLSQNRPEGDAAGVITALSASAAELADAMRAVRQDPAEGLAT
jgi:transcriptional regulator